MTGRPFCRLSRLPQLSHVATQMQARRLTVRSGGVILAVLCLGWLGCGRWIVPDGVLARLGSQDVETESFEAFLQDQVGSEVQGLAPEVLSALLDQYFEELLLVRWAQAEGLEVVGSDRRSLLDVVASAQEGEVPSEQELIDYYDAHRDAFTRPERVRLGQILSTDRESAEQARAEVAGGADFLAVLRPGEGSESRLSGGDQGELAYDDLPEAFRAVILSLAEGQVSPVVETEYGFHVFQVLRRLPAQVLPLGDVRDEIALRVAEERADQALAQALEEAKDRFPVVIYEENLSFPYRGTF